MTITHKVEKVTPELAEKLLETNTKNRKLSSEVVTKLADQMKNGQWNFDGSPVRIDSKGDLVDGQHRLWAIIESGTTQEFLIVRGVDETAMATMDTGKSRSFADILSMEDKSLTSVANLAAATSIIYRWEQGVRGSALRAANTNFVPYPLLLQFFRDNRERLIQAERFGGLRAKRTGATPSAFALASWVFEPIDAADAEFFFERVKDGAGLEIGSPILALRRWLLNTYTDRPRPQAEMAIALIFKAWNFYRRGETIGMLTWKRGGSAPEAFPIPE